MPSLAAPTALVLSVWQVNALALFHLLDFGSGFDSMLLAKTGRGERLLEVLLRGAVGQGCSRGCRSIGLWKCSVLASPRPSPPPLRCHSTLCCAAP